MLKLKNFFINEISGWRLWEIMWLLLSVVIITGLSLYWGDSLIGIISAVTGILYVILTGKGKLSAFIFGLVNSVLYGWIAYKSEFYGEVMLNWIYYVPMQFVGFFTWSKHINESTNEVEKRQMTPKGRGILFAVIAIGTLIYGTILNFFGSNLSYVDSFTTVTSVIAMVVSIRMYTEQWIIWIIVDAVTVLMWGYAYFFQGSESIATLIMWILYLASGIIMYIKWHRESAV